MASGGGGGGGGGPAFRELKANDIPLHPIIIFNGKTRSGKSTIMEWVFWRMARSKKHRFEECMLFCPSSSFRNTMAKHFPKCTMHFGWEEGVLAAEITRRRERANAGKRNPPMIFIMDDCMDNTKELNKSRAFAELLKVARQYKITRFIVTHDVCDLANKHRDQADIVILPKFNQIEAGKRLYKYMAGQFENFNEFWKTFKGMTKNYRCMVLHQTANNIQNITDEVFWIRAFPKVKAKDDNGPRGPVRVGKELYWQISKAYYSQRALPRRSSEPYQRQQRDTLSGRLRSGGGGGGSGGGAGPNKDGIRLVGEEKYTKPLKSKPRHGRDAQKRRHGHTRGRPPLRSTDQRKVRPPKPNPTPKPAHDIHESEPLRV